MKKFWYNSNEYNTKLSKQVTVQGSLASTNQEKKFQQILSVNELHQNLLHETFGDSL
jgi:hypothetical protein